MENYIKPEVLNHLTKNKINYRIDSDGIITVILPESEWDDLWEEEEQHWSEIF
jgi:hypothetical protein